MSTSSISSLSSASSSTSTTSDAMSSVGVNDFLKLLLTELQNQDPLNPTDTNDILNQVSQIKAIQSNQQLTDTLTSMQLQQGLAAASSLLQKNVKGLTDSGETITGVVGSVTINDSAVTLNVGDQSISLKNVSEITPS